MADLATKLQALPMSLQNQLNSFQAFSLSDQLQIRDEVLRLIASPSVTVRVAAASIAYFVSTKYSFLSKERQLDIAGALIGGHLGYYSVELIKKTNVYVATPLEESLVAALGGMYGTELLTKFKGSPKANSIAIQTYNLYVLLTHLIPVLLRIKLIKDFQSLYPLKAQ